jgi:hypothetical protein
MWCCKWFNREVFEMKLICINNKPIKGAENNHLQFIKEGRVYTVDCYYANIKTYSLEEVPFFAKDGRRIGYVASRFIPISTIDETELIKEREKELV